jgi:Zn-dependent alcohol dehydrogenase
MGGRPRKCFHVPEKDRPPEDVVVELNATLFKSGKCPDCNKARKALCRKRAKENQRKVEDLLAKP